MRILLINNFHHVGGGSERVYRNTANLLREKGHEVAYISTLKNGEKDPSADGIFFRDRGHEYLRPDKFFYKGEVATKVFEFLQKWKPDIAHLHIFYGRLTSAVLSALHRYKVPSVMSVHDYRMLCPTYTMRTWKGDICERCASGAYWHAITNKCNRGSLVASGAVAAEAFFRDQFFNYSRHIDWFIFVSKFCQNIHLKFRPELADKSSVLYNFTNSSAQHPSFSKDRKTLLYAGRLSREKGVSTLLKALAAANCENQKLRVAGDGPELSALKQQAYELSLEDRVQFLGKLDKKALIREFRSARWLVVPSEWYENNPMVVLEAFSHGTPVIGSEIGGIPELVQSRETGLLYQACDVADLCRALKEADEIDEKKYYDMCLNVYKFISEGFDPMSHYDGLMKIYNNL